MGHVFMPRIFEPPVSAQPVAVTITGSGSSSYCYAVINGTTYTGATSGVEVMPGDTITFGLKGWTSYEAYLYINDVKKLTATSTLKTLDWAVPDNITKIDIEFIYVLTDNWCELNVTTS